LKNVMTTSILVVTAALLVLPMQAFAHVTLQPDSAPAGGFVRLDVRVPNETEDADTNKVQVQFPDGFAEASYEPVPGWRASVKKKKLATPVTSDEGDKITDQVSQITWTAQGSQDAIAPGQFQDFGLSVQVPDKPNTKLTFKAIQTYDNGDVVRWIGAPDADDPAPQVEVTPASAAEPATQTAAKTEAEDDESNTLPIIALIVGGLGLLTGGFALARRRA
jgi:uncharacterized protein